MSTNSFIGTIRPTGYIKGIYCHWDGYPEYTGTVLNFHYTNLNKIERLLDLGNISILGENVYPLEDGHSYDNALPKTVVAYHRDRGDEYTKPIGFNIKKFNERFTYYVSYAYLYDLDLKKWRTFKVTLNGLEEIKVNYKTMYKKAVEDGFISPIKNK